MAIEKNTPQLVKKGKGKKRPGYKGGGADMGGVADSQGNVGPVEVEEVLLEVIILGQMIEVLKHKLLHIMQLWLQHKNLIEQKMQKIKLGLVLTNQKVNLVV